MTPANSAICNRNLPLNGGLMAPLRCPRPCRSRLLRVISCRAKEAAVTRRKALLGPLLPCACPACAASEAPRNKVLDRFFAYSMATGMGKYEDLLAPVKETLFDEVFGGLERQQPLEVLELGIGTAPNLKYYPRQGLHLTGIDPNASMEAYARDNARSLGYDGMLSIASGVAEDIPAEDNSVDVLVGTLIMCSVPDVERALLEIHRVLKPGGRYVFIEHVAAAPGTVYRVLQEVFNPLQVFIADGCHLNRTTGERIEAAAFGEVNIKRFFVPGLSIIGFHIAGIATK